MSKPDFEKMAGERLAGKQVYLNGAPYTRQFGEIFAASLEAAFKAGLDRAAEIAEQWRDGNPDAIARVDWSVKKAAGAIRAEREKS